MKVQESEVKLKMGSGGTLQRVILCGLLLSECVLGRKTCAGQNKKNKCLKYGCAWTGRTALSGTCEDPTHGNEMHDERYLIQADIDGLMKPLKSQLDALQEKINSTPSGGSGSNTEEGTVAEQFAELLKPMEAQFNALQAFAYPAIQTLQSKNTDDGNTDDSDVCEKLSACQGDGPSVEDLLELLKPLQEQLAAQQKKIDSLEAGGGGGSNEFEGFAHKQCRKRMYAQRCDCGDDDTYGPCALTACIAGYMPSADGSACEDAVDDDMCISRFEFPSGHSRPLSFSACSTLMYNKAICLKSAALKCCPLTCPALTDSQLKEYECDDVDNMESKSGSKLEAGSCKYVCLKGWTTKPATCVYDDVSGPTAYGVMTTSTEIFEAECTSMKKGVFTDAGKGVFTAASAACSQYTPTQADVGVLKWDHYVYHAVDEQVYYWNHNIVQAWKKSEVSRSQFDEYPEAVWTQLKAEGLDYTRPKMTYSLGTDGSNDCGDKHAVTSMEECGTAATSMGNAFSQAEWSAEYPKGCYTGVSPGVPPYYTKETVTNYNGHDFGSGKAGWSPICNEEPPQCECGPDDDCGGTCPRTADDNSCLPEGTVGGACYVYQSEQMRGYCIKEMLQKCCTVTCPDPRFIRFSTSDKGQIRWSKRNFAYYQTTGGYIKQGTEYIQQTTAYRWEKDVQQWWEERPSNKYGYEPFGDMALATEEQLKNETGSPGLQYGSSTTG